MLYLFHFHPAGSQGGRKERETGDAVRGGIRNPLCEGGRPGTVSKASQHQQRVRSRQQHDTTRLDRQTDRQTRGSCCRAGQGEAHTFFGGGDRCTGHTHTQGTRNTLHSSNREGDGDSDSDAPAWSKQDQPGSQVVSGWWPGRRPGFWMVPLGSAEAGGRGAGLQVASDHCCQVARACSAPTRGLSARDQRAIQVDYQPCPAGGEVQHSTGLCRKV